MIVCDSACCEVGFSALNRTQTQSRSNLKVSAIREVLTTHFLGDPIKEFKPGPIYEKWIDLPFEKGNNNSRGRELQSMMRRVVKASPLEVRVRAQRHKNASVIAPSYQHEVPSHAAPGPERPGSGVFDLDASYE